MKTDIFTKVLLAIISICLVIITFNQINIIPKAFANDKVNSSSLNFKYALVPLNSDGSIDVNIKSSSGTVDVDITDISTSDELDVNVEEVGGYSTYGKVPVEIKR